LKKQIKIGKKVQAARDFNH